MQKITIHTPDDWHCHLREGSILKESVQATARCFNRAIVMPNLKPPISTAAQALEYKASIVKACENNKNFEPLVTLFLTNQTSVDDIRSAKQAGLLAAKLYPAGVTTNSSSAVDSIEALYPIFKVMSEVNMLLLIHGEVNDPTVDIFDREAVFIKKYLIQIVKSFPDLKIVFEHISTSEAVDFVLNSSDNIAATITPQHMLFNRNDLLVGGIKPHNYCLPILKRSTHQAALIEAIKLGSKKLFLGTDSAPHEQNQKESACGCAGCYTAPVALELYAQIFDQAGALDKLEGFASFYGADFYGLPRNQTKVTLVKDPWAVPEKIVLEDEKILIPFLAGQQISWRVITATQ